jgi:ribonuclease Y
MNDLSLLSLLGSLSILGGYGLFRLLLHSIPRLEAREIEIQKDEILKEGRRQKDVILQDTLTQEQQTQSLLSEDLEAELAGRKEDLESFGEELASREGSLEGEEKRLERREENLQEALKSIEEREQEILTSQNIWIEKKQELVAGLAKACERDVAKLTQTMTSDLVEYRQLESQKVIKLLQEDISAMGRKRAQRVLDRILARYEPKFIWPKPTHMVEVQDPKLKEAIEGDSCSLVKNLGEISGLTIVPHYFSTREGGENQGMNLKISGGSGLFREAARQTLQELLTKGPGAWKDGGAFYQKALHKLDQECLRLGGEAVKTLALQNIHPEIQKLVGALNWRTSYRQNQWYHTLEVAILAGLLAQELGVDPDQAKRVGMLHDIGKALDYRIEGSHAVISGDYADRYGESRIICDTVMSHHADLLVETPLAYILRAADTLSGARPGARVNLEEGYQIRIGAIYEAVQSFPGVLDCAIMNGGREVHIQVNPRRVPQAQVKELAQAVARKIETDVAYPGQIKVVVLRFFESSCVA